MFHCSSRNLAIVLIPFLSCQWIQAAPEVQAVRLSDTAFRPQAVLDSDSTLHIVHAHKTRRGDLFYIKRKKGEKEFSKPILVNSTPGCAAAFNMAVGKKGRVHVLIRPNAKYSRDKLMRRPKFVDLKYMLYCRLNDKGTAFEEERDLSGKTFAFEGVGALLADGKGTVHVFWHGLDKPGREPTRKIFTVKSTNEGKTFSEPTPIRNFVRGACACCSMQGLLASNGDIYLAYRNSIEEDGRKDSYLLKSSNHGRSFQSTMLDPWKQAGCPGSIYSLAETEKGVVVSWDTEGHVFFRSSEGKVKRVMARTRKKSRGAVVTVNNNGDVLFAWSEVGVGKRFAQGSDLAYQIFNKDGKPISRKKVIPAGVARWSFPAAVAQKDGSFLLFHDG